MPDRSSRGSKAVTLTVAGQAFGEWITATYPRRALPTGSYATSGGAVATVGVARPTATVTLTKKYDEAQFNALERALASFNVEAKLVYNKTGVDGSIVGKSRPFTGVLAEVYESDFDRGTGEADMMMVDVTVDGT